MIQYIPFSRLYESWNELNAPQKVHDFKNGVVWRADWCVRKLGKATEAVTLGKICKVFKSTLNLLQKSVDCLANSRSGCSEVLVTMADGLEPLVRSTEGFVSVLGASKLLYNDLPDLIKKNAKGEYLITKKKVSKVVNQVALTIAHAIDLFDFCDKITGFVGVLSAANRVVGAAAEFLPPVKIVRSIVMVPAGITGIINNVRSMNEAYHKKDLLKQKQIVWQNRVGWNEAKVKKHYKRRAKLNELKMYIQYAECARLLDKKAKLLGKAGIKLQSKENPRMGDEQKVDDARLKGKEKEEVDDARLKGKEKEEVDDARLKEKEEVDDARLGKKKNAGANKERNPTDASTLKYCQTIVQAFYKISKKNRDEQDGDNGKVIDCILDGDVEKLRETINKLHDGPLKQEAKKAAEVLKDVEKQKVVSDENLKALKRYVLDEKEKLHCPLDNLDYNKFNQCCQRNGIDRSDFDRHIDNKIIEVGCIEKRSVRYKYLSEADGTLKALKEKVFKNKEKYYKGGSEQKLAQRDANKAKLGITFSAVMLASGVTSLVAFFAGITAPWLLVAIAVGFTVGAVFDVVWKIYPELHEVHHNGKWRVSKKVTLEALSLADINVGLQPV